MADYWKSQPRKFCDFCKCWITDNKPSVEFHERGKRHQENVRKKIDDVKKKSMEKVQADAELEDDYKKMEEAALAAFKKDLQENPNLAAQYGVRVKSAADKESKTSAPTAAASAAASAGAGVTEAKASTPTVKEWYEAVSDQGYTYYWNISTGQSVWEKPESYMSLAEQGVAAGEATPDTNDATEAKPSAADSEDAGIQQRKRHQPAAEEKSKDEDDSDDENGAEEKEKEEEKIVARQDSRSSRSAYGRWEAVITHTAPPLDLQLPTEDLPVEDIPLPVGTKEETEKKKDKFKEKKVISLGKSGEKVAFKKRKIMAGARNVRQRGEDD